MTVGEAFKSIESKQRQIRPTLYNKYSHARGSHLGQSRQWIHGLAYCMSGNYTSVNKNWCIYRIFGMSLVEGIFR